MNEPLQANLAETLAREMKTPIELLSEPAGNLKRAALPPGWTHEDYPYDYETREVLG